MLRFRTLLAGLVLIGHSSNAFSQGCAMCWTSAMAQGSRAIDAMNVGILILLVPSFLMIVGILVFAFLRRSS